MHTNGKNVSLNVTLTMCVCKKGKQIIFLLRARQFVTETFANRYARFLDLLKGSAFSVFTQKRLLLTNTNCRATKTKHTYAHPCR